MPLYKKLYKALIHHQNKIFLLCTDNIKILKLCSVFFNTGHLLNHVNENKLWKLIVTNKHLSDIKNLKFIQDADYGTIYYNIDDENKNATLIMPCISKYILPSTVKYFLTIISELNTNRLVLHSSLVKYNNNFLLIPGSSGTGKSTTALLLAKLSATLICEDLAIISEKQLSRIYGVVFVYKKNENFSYIYEIDLLYKSFAPNLFIKPKSQLLKFILYLLKNKKLIRIKKLGFIKTLTSLKNIIQNK